MTDSAGAEPALLAELERLCGPGGVFHEPVDLLAYECDGLPHLRAVPAAVVLPSTAADRCRRSSACVTARVCRSSRAGTAPASRAARCRLPGGVVIGLGRLNRVLEIDIPNRRVTVEPGVTNLEITRRVAPHGYYYAPDPSSQQVCSIGGNIAENSGGAHCLKYGFTVHHVLALDFVLPDGELVHIGNSSVDAAGPGSARADHRLRRHARHRHQGGRADPAASRRACRRCSRRSTASTRPAQAVSDIIAAGIVPGGGGDHGRVDHPRRRGRGAPGFPPADAVLIVELDGPAAEVQALFETVEQICRQRHASAIEVARDEAQRARIWKGRKAAFAAMGRVSPNYYVQDGVVPRTRLPEVLRRIRELEARSGLRIGNVFHAGDGNLHPLICYDEKRARRGRSRRRRGGRDPLVLRRSRRIDHRRARRRRRQARLHAGDVRRSRSRDDAPRPPRVRSARPLQSGKGASDAAALRREGRAVPSASRRGGGAAERL